MEKEVSKENRLANFLFSSGSHAHYMYYALHTSYKQILYPKYEYVYIATNYPITTKVDHVNEFLKQTLFYSRREHQELKARRERLV